LVSITAKQSVEYAQYILLLRKGISQKKSDQVDKALIWLNANASQSPCDTREEVKYMFHLINISIFFLFINFIFCFIIYFKVQRASIIHQNDIILDALTLTLSVGKATGKRGNINKCDINIEILGEILKRARLNKYQSSALKNLIQVGEAIFILRCSLLADNMLDVNNAVKLLAKMDHIPDIVVEEIGMARSEVSHKITIVTLMQALDSIDMRGFIAIDRCLLSIVNLFEDKEYIYSEDVDDKNNNIYNSNCLHSIDIDIIDNSIEISQNFGLISEDCKYLYKIMSILKSLRYSIKISDWANVRIFLLKYMFFFFILTIFLFIVIRYNQ
jgi:hypothetical protein